MIQKVLCFLLLLSTTMVSAQNAEVKEAMSKLETILVGNDTTGLGNLLHPELGFGHSNGWVQTRADVINDLVSGKLRYKKLDRFEEQWTETENVVAVRYTSPVTYVLNGTEGSLDLHIVQVWIHTKQGWQLLTRQSTKIQPTGK